MKHEIMKQLLAILFACLSISQSKAMQKIEVNLMPENAWISRDSSILPSYKTSKKYILGKHLNTAGWLTFSAGACSYLLGGMIKEGPDSDWAAWGDFFSTGGAQVSQTKEIDHSTSKTFKKIGKIVMLASVPMFVFGAITKHKAKISFKYQRLNPGIPASISKEVLGASLSIPLGR